MDGFAELNRSGFTAQVDVESSSKTNVSFSGFGRHRKLLRVGLGIGAGVACLVILVVGGLALQDRLSLSGASASRRSSSPLTSKSISVSSKHSSRSYTLVSATPKTVDSASPLLARIWNSVKQRPKSAAMITSTVIIIIIGAIVASVLLLRLSQTSVPAGPPDSLNPKGQQGQSTGTPSPSAGRSNLGVIIGVAITGVAIVAVIAVLIKFKPWAKRELKKDPLGRSGGADPPHPDRTAALPLAKNPLNKPASAPSFVENPRDGTNSNRTTQSLPGEPDPNLLIPALQVENTLSSQDLTSSTNDDSSRGSRTPNSDHESSDVPDVEADPGLTANAVPPTTKSSSTSDLAFMGRYNPSILSVNFPKHEANRLDKLISSGGLRADPCFAHIKDDEFTETEKLPARCGIADWRHPNAAEWEDGIKMRDIIRENLLRLAQNYERDYPEQSISLYVRNSGDIMMNNLMFESLADMILYEYTQVLIGNKEFASVLIENDTLKVASKIAFDKRYTFFRLDGFESPEKPNVWQKIYKAMFFVFSRDYFSDRFSCSSTKSKMLERLAESRSAKATHAKILS